MGVKIQGLVAAEGLKTVDGRVITGIDWHGFEKFPAYLLGTAKTTWAGHEDGRVFGWFKIDAVRSGLVLIKGELDFWPNDDEDYLGVGIDLDLVEQDDTVLDENAFADAKLVITGGRLRAMHVYADESRKPAWPFVKIWRVGQ